LYFCKQEKRPAKKSVGTIVTHCIIASCLNKPLSVDSVSYGFHKRRDYGTEENNTRVYSPLFKEAHEVENIVLPPGW
jgi:hypothetical protein